MRLQSTAFRFITTGALGVAALCNDGCERPQTLLQQTQQEMHTNLSLQRTMAVKEVEFVFHPSEQKIVGAGEGPGMAVTTDEYCGVRSVDKSNPVLFGSVHVPPANCNRTSVEAYLRQRIATEGDAIRKMESSASDMGQPSR